MKFEQQDYQDEATNNIIDLLQDFDFKNPNSNSLQECFKNFYNNQGKKIPIKDLSNKLNIDILMETGTGKTFTYLQTIFELNKHYNQTKFIILVPRVAIKSGVIQNINLTKNYFKIKYQKEICYIDNKSKNSKSKVSSGVNQFIADTSNNISILILTQSAIDKKTNILNQSSEKTFFTQNLPTNIALDAIKDLAPIIILDEPHLLKGEKITETLQTFSKSLLFRFGATFPKTTSKVTNAKQKNNIEEHKLSNVVYCLDSKQSFQNYLVKKIVVSTISNIDSNSIQLTQTKVQLKKFTINYVINNEAKSCELDLKKDIGNQTGIKDYTGIHATRIESDKVFLSNDTCISFRYELSQQEQKVLIQETIAKHFEKEEELFKKGIKTLSLFFIPPKSDFDNKDSPLRNTFITEYERKRKEVLNNPNLDISYKDYLLKDYKNQELQQDLQVFKGYFSTSKGTKDESEKQAIDTILNDKEKLLSFKEPLRFIFSIWALQEGWDNPNIFNICKLNNTESEISKRQQVGRGLRIAVNQQGIRLTKSFLNDNEEEFYNINSLDIFVSHKEGDFISSLQKEIDTESYIITESFTSDSLKQQANLNDRECNRIINLLEDKNIINFNESQNIYEIIQPIYDFLQQKQNSKELDFLTEDSYKNLLDCFKPTTNNYQQVANRKNKKQSMVSINKDLYQSFKDLWYIINQKATIIYTFNQSPELISNIIKDFSNKKIPKVEVTLQTKSLNPQTNQVIYERDQKLSDINFFHKNLYQDYTLSLVKESNFPLHFITNILNQILIKPDALQNILNNPKQAKKNLIDSVINITHQHILSTVSYNFSNHHKNSQIEVRDEKLVEKLNQNDIQYQDLGKYIDEDSPPPQNYLYNKIVYDSQIEKDAILNDPQTINNKKVTVFAKLPKISIQTPFKSYNPDFAYIIENNEKIKLFLVVETKGYNNESDIPQEEQLKINYAKKFFESLQKAYKDKDLNISFQTRLNNQTLSHLINNFNTNQQDNCKKVE
jgi:type III restriction enzyme